MDKETCRPKYQRQLDFYCKNNRDAIRLFAAGFITGQMEKVYLGACGAAMFRPKDEDYEMVLEIIERSVEEYGLNILRVHDEIWVHHSSIPLQVISYCSDKESKLGHFVRSMLCGVPLREIDYNFHNRIGSREKGD